MTFGFGRRRYIWMLAALIAMQVAQPYLAYESGPARTLSAALLFTVGFAVFISLFEPRPPALVGSRTCYASGGRGDHMTSCRRRCNRFSPRVSHLRVSFLAFVVALILLRLFHKRFLKSMTSSARLRAT